MSEYTAFLRGNNFRGIDEKVAFKNLEEGVFLDLVREPTNAFDQNAIMVMQDGLHLGYVAKEVAIDLAEEMDAGTSFNCVVEATQMGSVLLNIYPIE